MRGVDVIGVLDHDIVRFPDGIRRSTGGATIRVAVSLPNEVANGSDVQPTSRER